MSLIETPKYTKKKCVEEFVRDLDQWCVRSAVEFWYAFTHYYTMMDNRAKNTFWHFARTSTRHAVPIGRAVADLMHIYEEDDGNGVSGGAGGAGRERIG